MRLLSLALAGALSASALNAQPYQATPNSPALDAPGYCPASIPLTNSAAWGGELTPWNGVERPLIKVELGGDAICNDGTPAAMFVRPAPAERPNGQPNPMRRTYHIHLKGGGSCRTFEECRRRFCALGPAPLFRPGLMSSRGWADVIEGDGLFEDAPQNRFARANQVLIGYCSSDGWIGSTGPGEAVSVDAVVDPALETAAISRIAFMGEAILNEALSRLDAGLQTSGAGRTYRMPPLTRANVILISGDSAGAEGVRSHIDRIAARYRPRRVLAALDAARAIDLDDPALDFTAIGYSGFDAFMDGLFAQARSFYGVEKSALDQSCLAGGDIRACVDGYRLSRDHIRAPTMMRTSLGDFLAVQFMSALLTGGQNPAAVTAELSEEGLRDIGGANRGHSTLGPNCQKHVTFRDTTQMREMRVFAGDATLYRDLDAWSRACVRGACPQRVSIAPPAQPSQSICPP